MALLGFLMVSVLLMVHNVKTGAAFQGNCGVPTKVLRLPNDDNNHFVLGGNVASIEQFPWQVSLQDTSHYCGGTLLSKDWVLTAGHCFSRGKDGLSVVVGSTTINSLSNSAQRIKVKKVFIHPGFVSFSHKNDIALVKLEKSVQINDKVMPACLPDSKSPSLYAAGSAVRVSGWGNTETESNPNKLRFAQLPLISQKKCRSCYRASQITDNMVCAGKLGVGGVDACKGDSGGPLVREIDGKFTVIGVVSWGYGCGRPERPGVYIRTANYLTWIQNIIANY